MKRIILLCSALLFHLSSIAQGTDENIRIQVRVNWLESWADDGLAQTRHRWAFQVGAVDQGLEDCVGFGENGGDYAKISPNEVIFNKTYNFLPSGIDILLGGYEKEVDTNHCWAESGDDYETEKSERYLFKDYGYNRWHTKTISSGEFKFNISFRYDLPIPKTSVDPDLSSIQASSSGFGGTRETQFCDNGDVFLSLPKDSRTVLGLDDKKFTYLWEYYFVGDDGTIVDCHTEVLTTPGTGINRQAKTTEGSGIEEVARPVEECTNDIRQCPDGTTYDASCQQCVCTYTPDPRWYSFNQGTNPTSAMQYHFKAWRKYGKQHIRIRYRLYSTTALVAGPESDWVELKIFNPPPVLNYVQDTSIHYFSQAADLTQDYGDVEIQNVACKGDTTGTITIQSVSGGTGEYYYNLRGPIDQNTEYPHGGNGGAQTYNINGTGKPRPTPGNSSTWVTFPTDDTGSGVGGLRAGVYVLAIENIESSEEPGMGGRKCFNTYYFTIKEPEREVGVSIADSSDYNGFHVSCTRGNDGWVQLGAYDGIGTNYTYYLKADTTDASFITNASGRFENLYALHPTSGDTITYYYYAEDEVSCVSSPVDSFTLAAPPLLEAFPIGKNFYPYADPVGDSLNIQCFGGTDSLYLKARGGVYPYKFYINGSQVAEELYDSTSVVTLGGYPQGAYLLKVVDGNGCEISSDSSQLYEPTPVAEKNIGEREPNCFGEANGMITLSAQGGIPQEDGGYTFRIRYTGDTTNIPGYNPEANVYKPASDSIVFEDLVSGSYVITITDRYSCPHTFTYFLDQPEKISRTLDTQDVSCVGEQDGSATISFSGGTPPYEVSFTGPEGYAIAFTSVAEDQELQLDTLLAGTYRISLTDANDCILEPVQEEIIINEPNYPLQFSYDPYRHLQPISCFGANDAVVLLEATGGWTNSAYQFGHHKDSLSPNNTLYANLGPGDYTFYVQDGGGCLDSLQLTIGEPEAFVPEITDTLHVSCKGESNGGFNLSLSGGRPPYRMSFDSVEWQDAQSLSNLPAATYTLYVQDSAHCGTKFTIPITEPDLLTLSEGTMEPSSCGNADGANEVIVQGGTAPYTFEWRNSGDTVLAFTGARIENVGSGLYSVLVTDANNCRAQTLIPISDESGPKITDIIVDSISCYGAADGSIIVLYEDGTGAQTIRWKDRSETGNQLINLGPGAYGISITDENGCSDNRAINLQNPDPLEIRWNTFDPLCLDGTDGSLQAVVSGGRGAYQYQWEGLPTDSAWATNLPAGTYTLTVSDEEGCSLTESATIVNPSAIDPGISDTLYICSGQELVLDAGYPGSTYAWSSDFGYASTEQQATFSMPGEYQLTVTSPNGCIGEQDFVIVEDNNILQARFMLPSEALVGDTVVLVDISYPVPGESNWVYDEEHIVSLRRYELYEEVIFTQPGVYTIVQEASLGDCADTLQKQITILDAYGDMEGGRVQAASILEQFTLAPNPSQGKFTATVKLAEARDVTIRLMALDGRGMVNEQAGKGKASYSFAYDTSLPSGTYLLNLQVGKKSWNLRVVIY